MKLVMEKLTIPIPAFILTRRMIIERRKEGSKQRIFLTGIDVDGTPTTFIKSIAVKYPDNKIKDYPLNNYEPFEFNIPTSDTMNITLTFMGHYNEPKITLDHTHPSGDLSASMYLMKFNPLTGIWKIESPATIPNVSLKSLSGPFTIIVGNNHTIVKEPAIDNNRHHWAMFITSPDVNLRDFIESVTYHLHPTFIPNKNTITEPPYNVDRLGWGTFDVGVEILFKSGNLIKLTHDLKFNEKPHQKTYKIIGDNATQVYDLPDIEKLTIKLDD